MYGLRILLVFNVVDTSYNPWYHIILDTKDFTTRLDTFVEPPPGVRNCWLVDKAFIIDGRWYR